MKLALKVDVLAANTPHYDQVIAAYILDGIRIRLTLTGESFRRKLEIFNLGGTYLPMPESDYDYFILDPEAIEMVGYVLAKHRIDPEFIGNFWWPIDVAVTELLKAQVKIV